MVNKEDLMMRIKTGRLAIGAMVLGLILAAGGLLPMESWANRDGWSSHRGGHGDFAGRLLHRLLRDQKDLNLSEEQVGKIKAIAVDYAKTRIKGEAEVELADVDVRVLAFDQKSDMAAIEGAVRKSETAKTALRLERIKALRAAGAVLTPEQREKWRANMMERHRERDRDGRHAGEYEHEGGDSAKRGG